MRVHATLTIKVVYDETDTQQVKEHLEWLGNHIPNRGLLTPEDSEMIVDTWNANVSVTAE